MLCKKSWYISQISPYTHKLFSQNRRVIEIGKQFWRSSDAASPALAGLCPDDFSVSPQSLWATCATAHSYKRFSVCSDGTFCCPTYSFFSIHQWSGQVPGWPRNSVAFCCLPKIRRNAATACLLSISPRREKWPGCQFPTLGHTRGDFYLHELHNLDLPSTHCVPLIKVFSGWRWSLLSCCTHLI